MIQEIHSAKDILLIGCPDIPNIPAYAEPYYLEAKGALEDWEPCKPGEGKSPPVLPKLLQNLLHRALKSQG